MTASFITGMWGSADPDWWVDRAAAGQEQRLAERWKTKTLADANRATELMRSLDAAAYVYDDMEEPVLPGVQQVSMPAEAAGGHWRRKLLAIAAALEQFDAVVWLDLDAKQLRELPLYFWEQMHQLAPIQARIRQYKRRKCHHWRSQHQRTLCSAAFVYCRDRDIIRRAIDWMDRLSDWMPPEVAICLTEEHALSHEIDLMQGGWQGQEAYHAQFDPPWYTIRGEIFPCECPVFTAG